MAAILGYNSKLHDICPTSNLVRPPFNIFLAQVLVVLGPGNYLVKKRAFAKKHAK